MISPQKQFHCWWNFWLRVERQSTICTSPDVKFFLNAVQWSSLCIGDAICNVRRTLFQQELIEFEKFWMTHMVENLCSFTILTCLKKSILKSNLHCSSTTAAKVSRCTNDFEIHQYVMHAGVINYSSACVSLFISHCLCGDAIEKFRLSRTHT